MTDQAAPNPIRLDEVPGLADRADDLRCVSLSDVRIEQVDLDDGVQWRAWVIFWEPWMVRPLTWTLGLRPTREEAAGAVELLLGGLLEGQAQARTLTPSTDRSEPITHDGFWKVVMGWMRWWSDASDPDGKRSKTRAARPQSDPDPAAVSFGAAVRAKRVELGLSQAQLGAQVGLNQAQVSKVARGHVSPDHAQAVALAAAAGVETDLELDASVAD